MSYRPQVKADSNGTTQDLPLDAETVQGKTPVFTTTNQTISGVKIYKDTQKFESDINIDGTTTFGPTLFKSYLNSDGTITERGTLLSNKYSNIGHTHESLLDYGDTSNTIKIGYRGNGLTASQIAYIAGYSVDDPNNPNEHKIKDISKDVLKSWLGSEVSTGTLSANTALEVPSGYAFLVLVVGTNNYVKFGNSSSQMNNTAYHFMFIQGGGPMIARYFSSSTTLSMGTFGYPASFYFNSEVQYIKFKIG